MKAIINLKCIRQILFIITIFFILLLFDNKVLSQSKPLAMQTIRNLNNLVLVQQAPINPSQTYLVNNQFEFSAVAFKIAPSESFNRSYIIAGKDTLPIKLNLHPNIADEGQYSQLMVFDTLISDFTFYSADLKNEVAFIFINGFIDHTANKRMKQPANEICQEPVTVDQSVWRQGLPAPDYNRLFTEVNHVIVHHSATSNSLTNYTNVVRNIYLFHTVERGWSDIGYNYLIAPDGTIFQGRDPGSGQQDNVLGAHFCGRNSGTMGVCLIGTYSLIPPTKAALENLNHILTWKLQKEQLDPFAINPHPTNELLPVIAGHRDGCATECPGQITYELLPGIRSVVEDQIAICSAPAAEIVWNLYPNPVSDQLYLTLSELDQVPEIITLTNVLGQMFQVQPWSYDSLSKSYRFSLEFLAPGIYMINIRMADGAQISRKILVI